MDSQTFLKLKQLDKILNYPQEPAPSFDDKKWIRKGDILVMGSNITYKITPPLISDANQYTRIYRTIPNIETYTDQLIKHLPTKNSKTIAIIYLFEDKKIGYSRIGFSSNPLSTTLKLNLHKRALGDRSIFEKFSDSELKNVEFKIIEYILYDKRKQLLDRRAFWKDKLNCSD